MAATQTVAQRAQLRKSAYDTLKPKHGVIPSLDTASSCVSIEGTSFYKMESGPIEFPVACRASITA